MSSRIPSHKLSNGLYVSGRLEQPPKERPPTMAARSVPYTGGDIKKSGELGKMFDIPGDGPPSLKPSRPSSSSQHNSGSMRSGPNSGHTSRPNTNSGPLTRPNTNSGPLTRPNTNSGPIKKTSGPLTPLAPTGLITSGPLGSGPIGSNRRSGQLEATVTAPTKVVYGSAVTNLGAEGVKVGFRVSKAVLWVFLVLVAMALMVASFLAVAVKNPVIVVAVAGMLIPVALAAMWNYALKKRGLLGFVKRYPDAELRGALDGQYVKITGVVTCGSIPLETSYQKVSRCVYVSTDLLEYRGCGGKSANPKHRFFSWGCRYSEKYVSDFYISDFQSGLRALVKAGYGSKVSPFVKPSTIVDVTKDKKDLSPSFVRWLAEQSLSSDDRVMRLKEGYIKEGSTVSVMGVVRRHDNVLMIVPPVEPASTGCQWGRCLMPTYVEGLIVTCEESQDQDVINV